MSEPKPAINPYAPAAAVTQAPSSEATAEVNQVARASLPRTALRWFVVCSLSALPSFLMGFGVSNGQVAAMMTGILIFVIAYTTLDYRTASRPFRSNRQLRRTLRIAYGTRIAISFLYPIGAFLDIFCGMVSIRVTEIVSGVGLSSSDPMSFGATLLTTLVQGVLLNLVLGCFAVIVHLVQLFVIALRR